jgi:hypothetical protein
MNHEHGCREKDATQSASWLELVKHYLNFQIGEVLGCVLSGWRGTSLFSCETCGRGRRDKHQRKTKSSEFVEIGLLELVMWYV